MNILIEDNIDISKDKFSIKFWVELGVSTPFKE